MIAGVISAERLPIIEIQIDGHRYTAMIDTGFNGDLELPEALRGFVNPRSLGKRWANLGAGQSIEEELFLVDFPFDGRTVLAESSFAVGGDVILIGTGLLRDYQVVIDFPNSAVTLERMVDGNASDV